MTTKIYTSLPGIRPRRLSLGLKAVRLAEEVGVTKQAWFYWEAGESLPSAGYLPAIAQLLQCSIEDLYRDPGETDCHTSAAALVRNDGGEARDENDAH